MRDKRTWLIIGLALVTSCLLAAIMPVPDDAVASVFDGFLGQKSQACQEAEQELQLVRGIVTHSEMWTHEFDGVYIGTVSRGQDPTLARLEEKYLGDLPAYKNQSADQPFPDSQYLGQLATKLQRGIAEYHSYTRQPMLTGAIEHRNAVCNQQ